MEIQLKVDQDRIAKLVTVDEYLALLDGDVRTMISVLSLFVIGDDGNYLDKSEGRKVIGKLTLEEMKNATGAFIGKAEDATVPPLSGAA
jgi:hypothetical protein